MTILAIDPGPTHSAWVLYDGGVSDFGIAENLDLLPILRMDDEFDTVVIEEVRSYGMAVGRDVFQTVKWTGRFWEAASKPVEWLGRLDVKTALCHDARARDSNIRAALIDRWPDAPRTPSGKPAKGSPLYGISKDVWSALAVAVTFADREGE